MDRPSSNGAILQAEAYGRLIPLLLSERPAGCVHSIFQNGLNIRMGEHLVFIGTMKNGQLPFGIHLTQEHLQELLKTVSQECTVSWHSAQQQLTFGECAPTICLAGAVPFDWKIPLRGITEKDLVENLAMFVSILLTEPRTTGLNVDIESFLMAYLEGTTLDDLTEQRIANLLSLTNSSDVEEIDAGLRYFLGRGQGLTPSGDDHLVGLLAIHAATGILTASFVERLSHLLQTEVLTTDIGREYLLYALQGEFSSTVARLASALTQETDIYMLKPLLLDLLDMGHSSGIDTVFGMLLGLLARRRKQEWQKK